MSCAKLTFIEILVTKISQDQNNLFKMSYWESAQLFAIFNTCIFGCSALSKLLNCLKTPELYLYAVIQNPRMLRNMPIELITLKPCVYLSQFYTSIDGLIPNELRDSIGVIDEIIASDRDADEIYPFEEPEMFYNEHSSRVFRFEAIREKKNSLKNVPMELRTAELCEHTVKCNNWNICFVLKEHLTHQLCLTVIKKNPWAAMHVPAEIFSLEHLIALFQHDARHNLEYRGVSEIMRNLMQVFLINGSYDETLCSAHEKVREQ